jgi:hypothetical protein
LDRLIRVGTSREAPRQQQESSEPFHPSQNHRQRQSRSERERDFHDSHNCAYKEGRTQVDERKQKLEETEVEVESAVVGERSF